MTATDNQIVLFPFTSEYMPLLRIQERELVEKIFTPYLPSYLRSNISDTYANLGNLDNGSELWTELFCEDKEYDKYYFLEQSFGGIIKGGLDFIKQNNICLEKVFCSQRFTDNRTFKELLKICGNEFKLNTHIVEDKTSYIMNDKIRKVGCPVIGVFSLSGENNKQEVCYELYQELIENGKKAKVVFTNELFSLIGFETFDHQKMLKEGIDNYVLKFSNYLFKLQFENNLDMIIIEIPGNIMMFDEQVLNNCGVESYLLSRSVKMDLAICCVPLTLSGFDYYSVLAEYICRTFNIESTLFHMSNYCVAERLTRDEKRIRSFPVKKEDYIEIMNMVNSKEKIIYNLRDKKEITLALL